MRRTFSSRNLWLDCLAQNRALATKISMINKELFRTIKVSEPEVLYEASMHLIKSGGKRLRPLLTLVACEAVGGNFRKALPVATAIELIHTASLIHDDLVDEDLERRGAPTVHVKYDRNVAVLSGDLLISKAMQIISASSSPKVRKTVCEACVEMSEGEYLDLAFKTDPETATEEDYLKMVRKKTGGLARAAAKCGAIIGGGTDKQLKSLSSYGESLGVSLQLRDDVREILTVEVTSTATANSRLINEGSNLVLIHSLRNSGRSSRNILRSLVSRSDCSRLKDAIGVFENSMSIQYVQKLSEQFEREARNAISDMHFQNKQTLEELAGLVGRD
jgi:geranylgeranyl pyrophosphate synthase